MYFEFIKDTAPQTEELKALHDSLYENLRKAEELYWNAPQKSGMLMRKATEKVCKIYNRYYEIGFPENILLEDYLCYTGDEHHNMMVSRFLSVVRKEQRDYLEWLRVWGDECVFMDENPHEIERSQDKLYLNVKKMMSAMLNVTREMCEKIDHMEGLGKTGFDDTKLPGYRSEEELEELRWQKEEDERKARRKNFFSIFTKKDKKEKE